MSGWAGGRYKRGTKPCKGLTYLHGLGCVPLSTANYQHLLGAKARQPAFNAHVRSNATVSLELSKVL